MWISSRYWLALCCCGLVWLSGCAPARHPAGFAGVPMEPGRYLQKYYRSPHFEPAAAVYQVEPFPVEQVTGLGPEQARVLFHEELVKAMIANGLQVSQTEAPAGRQKPKEGPAKPRENSADLLGIPGTPREGQGKSIPTVIVSGVVAKFVVASPAWRFLSGRGHVDLVVVGEMRRGREVVFAWQDEVTINPPVNPKHRPTLEPDLMARLAVRRFTTDLLNELLLPPKNRAGGWCSRGCAAKSLTRGRRRRIEVAEYPQNQFRTLVAGGQDFDFTFILAGLFHPVTYFHFENLTRLFLFYVHPHLIAQIGFKSFNGQRGFLVGDQAHPGHQIILRLAGKADNVRWLNFDEGFGVAAQLNDCCRVGGIVAEDHPFFAKFVERGIGFHGKNYFAAAPRRYQAVVIHGAAGAIQFYLVKPQRRIACVFQSEHVLQGLVFKYLPQIKGWLGNFQTGGGSRRRQPARLKPAAIRQQNILPDRRIEGITS